MRSLKVMDVIVTAFLFIACSKQSAAKVEEENERQIKISELPSVVKIAIENKFSGAVLQEADEITKNDGSLTYDIEIRQNNNDEMEVMFDARGKYLGVEADDDDVEGDDED